MCLWRYSVIYDDAFPTRYTPQIDGAKHGLFRGQTGNRYVHVLGLFDAVFTYHSTQLVSDWQSGIVNDYSTDGLHSWRVFFQLFSHN